METHESRILIYSSDTETIDSIFDLCELSQTKSLRLVTCPNEEALDDHLDHHECSLVFIDLKSFPDGNQLDAIAQRVSPKPTIAILPELDQHLLIRALRNGADSVFTQTEMRSDPLELVRCLDRQLQRAHAIEETRYLRDTLSKSLEELKADQDAAAQIQQRLLPPSEQTLDDGLHCEYILRPSMLLSGDFIDLINLHDNKHLFYLADVSGHGASSAMVTVLLKNMTNRLGRLYNRGDSKTLESPMALLKHFNREILLTSLGKHMTMLVGVIDLNNSTLTYSIGGHHPSPLLTQGGKTVFLEGRGMPVGLFEEPIYEEHCIDLDEQFSIALFSDGILEILEGDNSDEKEQNLRLQCQDFDLTPEQLLKRLVNSETEMPDDVAIMMVSRRC